LGADGFVPSIGPLFPKVCLKVYEYAKKQDIEKTMYWDVILNKAQSICTIGKNGNSATKYATSILGLTNDRMTLPFEPLTEAEKKEIYVKTKEMMEFLDKEED
jgi:4-hydroxy-tetrahydrodipicolinate synthase